MVYDIVQAISYFCERALHVHATVYKNGLSIPLATSTVVGHFCSS